MPSLQNRVMDMLIEKNAKTGTIPSFLLTIIYSNTIVGSPLRKFLIYMVAYKCDPVRDITFELSKRWPHEAFFDLFMVVAAKQKEEIGKFGLPEANKDKCYYHVHPDGENCDGNL